MGRDRRSRPYYFDNLRNGVEPGSLLDRPCKIRKNVCAIKSVYAGILRFSLVRKVPRGGSRAQQWH